MSASFRSEAEIVLAAWVRVGQRGVRYAGPDTPEESDDRAVAGHVMYQTARDELLYGTRWTWATERRRLALVYDAEAANTAEDEQRYGVYAGGYTHVFEYPSPEIGNLVAVYRSGAEEEPPVARDWTRRSGYLYARFPEAWAEYVWDVGPAAYPALFTAALVRELCSQLSFYEFQDPAIQDSHRRASQQILLEAKRVDAQSVPAQGFQSFRLLEARAGAGYSRRRTRGI